MWRAFLCYKVVVLFIFFGLLLVQKMTGLFLGRHVRSMLVGADNSVKFQLRAIWDGIHP